MTPIGSHGDVHPYLGLGTTLVQRGHDVTIMTSGHFESLVRQVGLKFVSTSPATKYIETTQDPDLWHPLRGFSAVMTLVLGEMENLYRLIQTHHEPGRTLLVGHTLGLAARVAHEKLGVPLVGVHLAPAVLRSVHVPPVMGVGPSLSWMPQWLIRLLWRVADHRVVDPVMCPALNHWRWELGLEPVRRPMNQWIHSPQLQLGLWPEWFAPVQPDWPSQMKLTGFSYFDQSGLMNLPHELRVFLEEGPPPIVFTPGSAMMHGKDFFREAAAACIQMNRRGVLLTPFHEQVPASLPDHVRHFDYVPLSQLLPHASAFVHHGGIGSSAQGLMAGVPQLIMPLAHDQHDNAARLMRLGTAGSLKPSRFTAANIQTELGRLLDQPHVWTRCQALALKCRQQQSREETCDVIERFGCSVGLDGGSSGAA